MKKLIIAAALLLLMPVLAFAQTPTPGIPAPTPTPYTGPQIVGVPVAASAQGANVVLPTVSVAAGQSLALCVKAAGTATQPVSDNLNNVWVESAAVAAGSSGAIHMLFAFTPSAGLTTVTLPIGCPTCYLGGILIQLTNAHDVAASIGNPYGTPTSPMQVTNGPLTLADARNRLILACSEIEAAPNTGLSLQPYPFVDDSTGDAAGVPVSTFVQGTPPNNGFTLGAAVMGVQDAGPFEIDLSFSPAENQAGALAAIE